MTLKVDIKKCIEEQLDAGKRKFIIFPFGDVGREVKAILSESYGVEVEYILDNHLSKYNPNIKPLAYLKEIECKEFTLILTTTNVNIYESLRSAVLEYIPEDNIVEFPSMKIGGWITKIGKYSYGPICRNHAFIESIGNFCGFATGTEAVPNHPMDCITTHPMIYAGQTWGGVKIDYNHFKNNRWFFEGVKPCKEFKQDKRSKIGNDVWLGRNVIITNGANIGNGVIAGAGSVITKDVPDYAVVVGAPARVIRYRYTKDQIKALNEIKWWDWSDEEIRERYEDFYLPIEEFIKKYYKNVYK